MSSAVRAVMELNYFGTLYSTMVFAEPMCEQGKGSIITSLPASAERPLTRGQVMDPAKAAVKN